MRLAYLIMAHKNPRQLRRLAEAIHSADNLYLIHMDRAADPACHRMVDTLCAKYPNICAMPSVKARLQGYSLVEIILKGIRQLLAKDGGWSYFINLSGQDFPLRCQGEIESFLSKEEGHNFVEYSIQYSRSGGMT